VRQEGSTELGTLRRGVRGAGVTITPPLVLDLFESSRSSSCSISFRSSSGNFRGVSFGSGKSPTLPVSGTTVLPRGGTFSCNNQKNVKDCGV
jgi:hypothetical protein